MQELNTVFKKANGETVDRDSWHWEFEISYKDGSTLRQFNEQTGLASGFFDINQEQVTGISMLNGSHRYDLPVPDGAKLILKRRTTVLAAGTEQEQTVVTYIFGFQLGRMKNTYHLVSHVAGAWMLITQDPDNPVKWVT